MENAVLPGVAENAAFLSRVDAEGDAALRRFHRQRNGTAAASGDGDHAAAIDLLDANGVIAVAGDVHDHAGLIALLSWGEVDLRVDAAADVQRADEHHGRGAGLVLQVSGAGGEGYALGGAAVVGHIRLAQEEPAILNAGQIRLPGLQRLLGCPKGSLPGKVAAAVRNDGPFIFPGDRQQEGLPAQVGVPGVIRSGGQVDAPPAAVGGLQQIAVSGASHARIPHRYIGQQRPGAVLVGAPDVFAAAAGDGVLVAGAALRTPDIIPIPDVVHMGRLQVFRLPVGHAVPDGTDGRKQFAGIRVDLCHGEGFPIAAAAVVGGDVAFVSVKEEVRVDAVDVHMYRIGPGTGGILRADDEVAKGLGLGGDVKSPVVIPDHRGPDALVVVFLVHGQLAGAMDAVADLRPVDQIPAVIHGDAGEELKGAGDQVIILPHPADAGIGIEAADDGVLVLHDEPPMERSW